MSEVKRYRFKGAAGEYVYANDYDAAQAERAALREELATQNRVLRSSVPEEHKACTSPVGAAQNYIGDLEQRNQSLVELLDEVLNEVPHGWGESFTDSELAERIRQAINPTESGASE